MVEKTHFQMFRDIRRLLESGHPFISIPTPFQTRLPYGQRPDQGGSQLLRNPLSRLQNKFVDFAGGGMALIVGAKTALSGDVTQLFAVGAKAPAGVEEMLGHGAGRLSRGYYICLLSGLLTPSDFEFSGNTLNSGGRSGLPLKTKEEDTRRPRIHSQILDERGRKGYEHLQKVALANITTSGRNRIIKILPIAGDDADASPATQYPMGVLQWRLLKPGKEFFVAVFVDYLADAQTPEFKVSVASNAHYEGRAKLHDYLTNVIS